MTAHAPDAATPTPAPTAVWDEQRLNSLLADVGETGLRNILRLFLADVPPLAAELAAAIAAGDARLARAVLAMLLDSAEALGLAALGSRIRFLAHDPLGPGVLDAIAEEAARIRFVPALKHAS